MPKRTRKSAAGSSRAVLILTASTLVLLAVGEILLLSRQDGWRLFAARTVGFGDPARVTQIVGNHVREGLAAAAIPPDSVRQTGTPEGRVAWRVGVPAHASLLQVNYAVTRTVEASGIAVLSGREQVGSHGEKLVRLQIGLPRRPTHDLTLVSAAPAPVAPKATDARIALVLYGLADDPETAAELFARPLPFAVALPAGAPSSAALFRAAREREREVVLHLPLEPINFPQINPGPGTILVTMKPVKITGLVRRYLDQAGPVAAVANHMGSLATQDMTVMRAVYQELRRRGVPFLHVAPAAGSVCKPLAADLGVEYDQPDQVIDGETHGKDTKALDRRWREALAEARRGGHLVVMLRVTPLTRAWLSSALSQKRLDGVSLVSLESLLRKPAAL
jgi:polysaccharide deacetylase 2 family uncharacterized protein YibQ